MNTTLIAAGLTLPWLIIAGCLGLGCWLGFQLVHQNGRLLARLETVEQSMRQLAARPAPAPLAAPPIQNPKSEMPNPPGLPLGAPAPAFELPDLSGARRRLADFRGRRLLLLFFNPGCGFCTRMAPELAALAVEEVDGRPLPLVITTGDAETNRKLVAEHGIQSPVLLQQGMEVASQYQCNGTPMGYLIDEQGRIASEMGIGGPALLALVGRSAGGSANPPAGHPESAGPLGGKRELSESKLQRDGLSPGNPAPDFRLPLLHGGELSLSDYRGRNVLLVFSDPELWPAVTSSRRQLEQVARRDARRAGA